MRANERPADHEWRMKLEEKKILAHLRPAALDATILPPQLIGERRSSLSLSATTGRFIAPPATQASNVATTTPLFLLGLCSTLRLFFHRQR